MSLKKILLASLFFPLICHANPYRPSEKYSWEKYVDLYKAKLAELPDLKPFYNSTSGQWEITGVPVQIGGDLSQAYSFWFNETLATHRPEEMKEVEVPAATQLLSGREGSIDLAVSRESEKQVPQILNFIHQHVPNSSFIIWRVILNETAEMKVALGGVGLDGMRISPSSVSQPLGGLRGLYDGHLDFYPLQHTLNADIIRFKYLHPPVVDVLRFEKLKSEHPELDVSATTEIALRESAQDFIKGVQGNRWDRSYADKNIPEVQEELEALLKANGGDAGKTLFTLNHYGLVETFAHGEYRLPGLAAASVGLDDIGYDTTAPFGTLAILRNAADQTVDPVNVYEWILAQENGTNAYVRERSERLLQKASSPEEFLAVIARIEKLTYDATNTYSEPLRHPLRRLALQYEYKFRDLKPSFADWMQLRRIIHQPNQNIPKENEDESLSTLPTLEALKLDQDIFRAAFAALEKNDRTKANKQFYELVSEHRVQIVSSKNEYMYSAGFTRIGLQTLTAETKTILPAFKEVGLTLEQINDLLVLFGEPSIQAELLRLALPQIKSASDYERLESSTLNTKLRAHDHASATMDPSKSFRKASWKTFSKSVNSSLKPKNWCRRLFDLLK